MSARNPFADYRQCQDALDEIERQNPHFRVSPVWIELRRKSRADFMGQVVGRKDAQS